MNTFIDFISVGEFLVAKGYTSPSKLYCIGKDYGGLLIGAVVNMAPDLYNGAIAEEPFVDLVTSTLNESIPLMNLLWSELGDPSDPTVYEYMLEYSPYDNVAEQAYPNMLVTSALQSRGAQYWESAKWVAKLRTHNTNNDTKLLLKTKMEEDSGRFQEYDAIAFKYAFLIDLASNTTTAADGSATTTFPDGSTTTTAVDGTTTTTATDGTTTTTTPDGTTTTTSASARAFIPIVLQGISLAFLLVAQLF